jgi:RNA polymerase sigma-70 factor, ECF subfamily
VTNRVGAGVYGVMIEGVRADVSVPFEVLLQDLIPHGYRLACGMLHDPAAAEDVVQEAAVKAWRKQSHLRPGSDARPWFLAIVANECRSARRSRWAAMLPLPTRARAAAPAAEDVVVRGADLRRAILDLPPISRLVVVLFFFMDLPLEEVARIAGLSTSAARGRLYRSIRRLRPGLEPQEALR